MATPAPDAAAHAGNGTSGAAAPAKSGGVVDEHDIADWKQRFNEVLAKPGETIKAPAIPDARPWHASFFGCCNPIDTCLITWCLPCITFGKTHHRTRKHGGLEGYEPVNTSCLLFLASACFGLHWVPQAMQRSEIRRKYNLEGSCITDIAGSCCCALCSLVQMDKEAEFREAELGGSGAGNAAQYGHGNGAGTMEYAPKA